MMCSVSRRSHAARNSRTILSLRSAASIVIVGRAYPGDPAASRGRLWGLCPAMAIDERLSDTEALMWSIECDPVLRATFLSVTFLDRPPDFARFRRRMGHAAARIPRLRQRIDGRQWVEDPDFDLDYHVRHIALPPPATSRHLLDDAARIYEHAFDPARPLWQLTMVDGLDGNRAALLTSMHHTLT